jgi:dATP pyrophosphohydrolase
VEREYKRPVSVLVVVYSHSGEVLMLRRKWPADFWQSVTGSLQWGETAQQAARRELKEETGLDAGDALVDAGISNRFPILSEWRTRYAPEVRFNTEHVFYLELPRPSEILLNPDEHSEYCWLAWKRAAERASSYTNRDAILAIYPSQDIGDGT